MWEDEELLLKPPHSVCVSVESRVNHTQLPQTCSGRSRRVSPCRHRRAAEESVTPGELLTQAKTNEAGVSEGGRLRSGVVWQRRAFTSDTDVKLTSPGNNRASVQPTVQSASGHHPLLTPERQRASALFYSPYTLSLSVPSSCSTDVCL